MVYRRSYRKKKMFRSRKRRMTNKNTIAKVPSSKVHLFKRTTLTTITQVSNATGLYHYIGDGFNQFKLSNIPNYTDFTNLFDQYKIVGIKQKFIYSSNSFNQATATYNNQMPMLLHVLDFDDGTALTTVNEYNQYDTCRISRTDKTFVRYFKPKVAQATYGSGVFTSYATPNSNPWIDGASINVEYYGNKFGMVYPTTGTLGESIGKLVCFTTYYIACRDTH